MTLVGLGVFKGQDCLDRHCRMNVAEVLQPVSCIPSHIVIAAIHNAAICSDWQAPSAWHLLLDVVPMKNIDSSLTASIVINSRRSQEIGVLRLSLVGGNRGGVGVTPGGTQRRESAPLCGAGP